MYFVVTIFASIQERYLLAVHLTSTPFSCIYRPFVTARMLFSGSIRDWKAPLSWFQPGRATTVKSNGILNASQMKRLDRNTVWVLTYEAKGKTHFLGSYPSAAEAEQAAEEYAHLHKTLDVVGYDARLLKVV